LTGNQAIQTDLDFGLLFNVKYFYFMTDFKFGIKNIFGTATVPRRKAEDTTTTVTISVTTTKTGKHKGRLYFSPNVLKMLKIEEGKSFVALEGINGKQFTIANISNIPNHEEIADGSVNVSTGTLYNLKFVETLQENGFGPFEGDGATYDVVVVDRNDTHGCPTVELTVATAAPKEQQPKEVAEPEVEAPDEIDEMPEEVPFIEEEENILDGFDIEEDFEDII